MIDPRDAAAALAKLENVIKTIDPEFTDQTMSIKELLAAFVPTPEHAAAAMAVGQNAQAILALARQEFAETATHLKNLSGTLPAGDKNSARLKALMGGLK